jgi:hypothetical protein
MDIHGKGDILLSFKFEQFSNLSISFRFDCILDYIMEISSIGKGNQSTQN